MTDKLTPDQAAKLLAKFEKQWAEQSTYQGACPIEKGAAWWGYLALATAMMSEGAVERAARADIDYITGMADSAFIQMTTWDDLSDGVKRRYCDNARATIEAALFGGLE